MKNTIAILALSFAAPALIHAQSGIAGTWIATGVGFAPWTFNLNASGSKLTGTVMQGATDLSGWSTSLTAPTAISDGTVDGNMISFKCQSPGGDRTITFVGTFNSDTILLRRRVQVRPGGDPGRNGIYGATGAQEFTAVRQSKQPAISGGQASTWTSDEVGFAPWTFRLTMSSKTVTGTVMQGATDPSGWRTALTAPTVIYDGTIDGNMISFKCQSPGGDRIITFAGVVDGDEIHFIRDVRVSPGGDPGRNGIYGVTGATHFSAKRIL